MIVRSSNQASQTSPSIPFNQTSVNLLHVEELTQPSQILDCRFNKVDLDFISCEAYTALIRNNSFIDFLNGMIDCFPIIFDSGTSLVIISFNDFTNDIHIPEK